MFTQAVLPDAISALKKISGIDTLKKAYLAGGTALALQLGHRISEDLDFFTPEMFDESVLTTEFMAVEGFREERRAWRTVLGWIGKTRFSIFFYKHPLISPTIEFAGMRLAGKPDIAAMKIRALGDRGTKRDFVDVYFLAKEYAVEKMLEFYDKKYLDLEDKMLHLLKSLSYFEDAENDEKQPEMLIDMDWGEVKSFFDQEAKRLAKSQLGV